MIRKFLQKIGGLNLSKLNFRKIFVVLAMSAGIYQVLMDGPQIQSYLISLLATDESSIYSSAYKGDLVKFPELTEWLFSEIYWPYAFSSLCIALCAMRKKLALESYINSAVAIFATLSIIDLINSIIDGDFSLLLALENLAANALGGLVLAGMIVLIMYLYKFIVQDLPIGKIFGNVIATISLFASGLLASAVIYFILTLFYKTNPIRIDAYLDQPASGFYSTENVKQFSRNDFYNRDRPFGLFPRRVNNASVEWMSPVDPLNISWDKSRDEPPYILSMKLYSGCLDGQKLPDNMHSSINFKFVKSIKANFDKGFSGFSTSIKNGYSDIGVESSPSDQLSNISMFWMQKDNDQLKLTRFMGVSNFNYSMPSFGAAPYLSGYLDANQVNGKTRFTPRKLTVIVNGIPYNFTFKQTSTVLASSATTCRQLSGFNLDGKRDIVIEDAGIFVGALLEMHPAPESFMSGKSNVVVAGLGGWLSMSGLTARDFEDGKADGWVSRVRFGGNVTNLTVSGKSKIEAHPSDIFTVMDGRIFAEYEANGKLRFTGLARSVYKNDIRMNKTRWEVLDWQWRALLLGAASTLITLALRTLRRLLRDKVDLAPHLP